VLTIEPAKSVVTYTEQFGSPLLLVVRCDQRRTHQFDLALRYYCIEIDRELLTAIDRLILESLLAFVGFLRSAVLQVIWGALRIKCNGGDLRRVGKIDCTLHHIFQFADVSRPMVLFEFRNNSWIKTGCPLQS
jgi:hypothetical protein